MNKQFHVYRVFGINLVRLYNIDVTWRVRTLGYIEVTTDRSTHKDPLISISRNAQSVIFAIIDGDMLAS